MDKNRVQELYKELNNLTQVAKKIAEEEGITYTDSMRRNVSRIMSKINNKGIFQECEDVGIDPNQVKHYWYKGKHYSINVKGEDNSKELDFDSVISECMESYTPIDKSYLSEDDEVIDRLVWTDVHTGMDASRKGLALYPTEWNSEMLFNNIRLMAEFVLKNKQSKILYIDELGDFMDGWDGETTRKGHKLPQNMTNEESFDNGLKGKILLIDLLCNHFDKIVCNNICEDNHAGAFGYVVNSAFKQIVDHKYTNVEVINHKKFINFYQIKNRMIVLTHGKDARNLRFGFKPHLDNKQIEKIDQFFKNYDIYKKCKYITFSKGDSHQALFDFASSDDFDYNNYPAFSPSSEWVQTNFKRGRRGFVLEHIKDKGARVVYETYFFEKLKY